MGTALPSHCSGHLGESAPTHRTSMSLYADEADDPHDHRKRHIIHGSPVSPSIYGRDPGSVTIWHPFSGPEPTGTGLHPSREGNRQSRNPLGHDFSASVERRTRSRGHSSHSDFDNA